MSGPWITWLPLAAGLLVVVALIVGVALGRVTGFLSRATIIVSAILVAAAIATLVLWLVLG